MDPNSRRSQFSPFNQRGPKAGPLSPPMRFAEAKAPGVDAKSTKRPAASRKSSSASVASMSNMRRIATNSRVRQDEQLRKDMHLAYVNNALQQKANGNGVPFEELVDQFNMKRVAGDAPSPGPQLRIWLLALSHVVSRLERQHAALVQVIVNLPWTVMDSAFVKAYINFIRMLVSARPEYLSLVLGTVTLGLTYQSGIQALDASLPESSTSPLTRRMVYDRLHELLRHLLDIVPTLSSTLQPLLVRNFPHKRQSQAAQMTYIRNLLRVTEYCPELADPLLSTIVERAIQIDVEIQIELEELEELNATKEEDDICQLDPFDTLVGQDEDASDSDSEGDRGDNLSDLSSDAGGGDDGDSITLAEQPIDIQYVQEMVQKLDAILKLIFDHYNRSHRQIPLTKSRSTSPHSSSSLLVLGNATPTRSPSPDSLERGQAIRRSQFHTLLAIFDRTIIRTFKSRYTQFLIFWYSSLDLEFSDFFLGMLVSKALLETDQPMVTRVAATSYLASFVSRARFIDREATRRVVGLLCNYLKNQLDAFDAVAQSGVAMPSVSQHSLFFAVAQATFLVFCFRWRDLGRDEVEEEQDEFSHASSSNAVKQWLPELNVMQRVVSSPLNPLKVCSGNVVMQFARVAHATGFIYCYSIMESNKRSEYRNPPSSPVGALARKPPPALLAVLSKDPLNAQLHNFFPFDPYNLPRSHCYIEGVYREWSSVAIDTGEADEDEDADGDGDDGEEEGAEAGDRYLAIPRPATEPDETDGLRESLGGMSISPSRPQ